MILKKNIWIKIFWFQEYQLPSKLEARSFMFSVQSVIRVKTNFVFNCKYDSFKCTVLCRRMYRSSAILGQLRDKLQWKKNKPILIYNVFMRSLCMRTHEIYFKGIVMIWTTTVTVDFPMHHFGHRNVKIEHLQRIHRIEVSIKKKANLWGPFTRS